MKKNDLKTGMRVELRNGDVYFSAIGLEGEMSVITRGESWGDLRDYNENLTAKHGDEFDVMKVYGSYAYVDLLDLHKLGGLLWERQPEKTFELDGVEYSESTLRSLIKKATKDD